MESFLVLSGCEIGWALYKLYNFVLPNGCPGHHSLQPTYIQVIGPEGRVVWPRGWDRPRMVCSGVDLEGLLKLLEGENQSAGLWLLDLCAASEVKLWHVVADWLAHGHLLPVRKVTIAWCYLAIACPNDSLLHPEIPKKGPGSLWGFLFSLHFCVFSLHFASSFPPSCLQDPSNVALHWQYWDKGSMLTQNLTECIWRMGSTD